MTAAVLVLAAIVLLAVAWRLARRRPSRPVARASTRALTAAPKRQLRRDVPHALYCYPHRFGGIVYVGISNEPDARHQRRMASFAKGDPRVAWVADSTGQMQIVRWLPDWYAARDAEDELIARLALEGHPLANSQGNPLRRRIRRAA